MRLSAVARAFNDTVCDDAYSGRYLFNGQFALYDDNKRDSETAERRIISVEDGTEVPARRVISAAGSKWILGHSNPDTFRGQVIRQGIVAHEATYLSSIRSIAQVCLNQTGTNAWAGKAWLKNLAFTEQSSRLVPQYHLHYAVGEPVQEDSILTFDGRLLVARVTTSGPSGTLIVLADQMPEPAVEIGSFSGATWDPVAGQMVGGISSARVMRVRWQSLFQYKHGSAPTFGPGDVQIAVAKASITPAPGTRVTLSDGVWQLASVQDEGDIWLCRATRYG